MPEGANFAQHIEFVATAMLQATHGEPNRALSAPGRELRFGKKGSLSVDIAKGTWHDHELDEGGGTLDLLKLYGGMEQHEAIEWMVERGLIPPTEKKGAKREDKFLGFMEHHPEKIFVYRDDKGQVAYEVLKFPKESDGPRYMQRRPAPNAGGWVFGLQAGEYGKTKGGHWFKARDDRKYQEKRTFDDAPRWLYRRDEVLKAIADGRVVVLLEGEKDADTVRDWNLTATTNAGGAKFWTPGMTADLAGAHVVICSDNDDPGRHRTLMLGAQLRGVAKTVRVLDLSLHWPDMPAKGDVSDWKEQAGGTADAFELLIEKAPPWRPEAPPSRFGAIGWSDMEQAAPDFEYLVEGWVPLRGRSVVGGPSQAGKSFLTLDMALSVARGVPFLGNPVLKRGVIYQAGEGGTGAKQRVKAYRTHHEVPLEEDVPFVFLPSTVDLFSKDGDTAALIEDIKAQALMLSEPLGLVVIDTLATATAGADENSGKDMGVVLANIARIEKECDCHVSLVHHMNADGKKLRGHTSIFANVDTVITILNDDQTKVRTATLSKQKDDETGINLYFELMAVEVGFNERANKPRTSCVVLPKGQKEMLQAEKGRHGFSLRPKERTIMDRLFKAEKRYGKFVASEEDGPAAAIGRSVVDWQAYVDVALESEISVGNDPNELNKAKDRIRKEFERERDNLARYGVIGFARPFMWWAGKHLKGFPNTAPRKSAAADIWREHEAPPLTGLEESHYDSDGMPF